MQKFNLKLISSVVMVSGAIVASNPQPVDYDYIFKSMRQVSGVFNKGLFDFFSTKNHDPMVVHVENFYKIKIYSVEKIEELRKIAGNNQALCELITYFEDILKQFNRFIDIVDEFKHKTPSHLKQFTTKLSSEIDIKKSFNDIISKLEKLHAKHVHHDKPFAQAMDGFIRYLNSIVQQWEKKKPTDMFNEICARMSKRIK